MNRWNIVLALALTTATVAGCVTDSGNDKDTDPLTPYLDALGRLVTPFTVGEASGEIVAAAGAIAELTAQDAGVAVQLTDDLWVLQDGAFVAPSAEPWDVAPGETLRFLVPPFSENLSIEVHTADHSETTALTVGTPYVEGQAFVDAAHIMDLYEIQRVEYPHRTPGHPNYKRSQEYFEGYFKALGYEVTRDPYGLTDAPRLPTDQHGATRNIQAGSMANVVAYRPGTGTTDRIVAFGGHYDMVENTRDAAFDDTSGTLATMALAKAFANVTTDVGLLFGLWGGEEDGILGSQFFVRSNPEIVSRIVTYVNLDVVSMAWPGPAINPDPIVITAGPDGPTGDNLLAQAEKIFTEYVPQMPKDLQVYEGVAEGQATGAGVNAQSDHTPFVTAGVPSYFIFDGNISNVRKFIHGPQDTVYNMTWFMATNEMVPEGTTGNPPLDPEQLAFGRHLLMRSFDAQLALPLYLTLEIDAGLYTPPMKE